jgi:outer membrane protein OmpA-like peptidoglycan-associated protein/tetratricopeptide (TPR) repeat protein
MKNSGFYLRIVIATVVFVSISIYSNAQWYNPEKVNKKAASYYSLAYELAQDAKFEEALSNLEKALALDPKFVDVYLSRAGIYSLMRDYTKSVVDYEKGMSMDADYSKSYLLPYSISLAGTGNFEKALATVNQFLTRTDLNSQSKAAGAFRKSSFEFAIANAAKTEERLVSLKRTNMGDSINSLVYEYFPSLTIDGKKMIFTRRINNDEDFYQSDLINGVWSNATALKGRINTNFNEGAQNISQDGEWLIFTGCNYPEGVGSCDLYIAKKAKNGSWNDPENLGDIINTDAWESSPSLSPDKRFLYFSSNRLGGYGGKDIWVSERNNQNRWGKPFNLGPTINTKNDEASPFIHADNQTLYFSSDGLPGYGNTDLFVSKKQTDGTWGEPLNLGYPINTIDDEGSLIVSADGRTGYYASDGVDAKGKLDLYTFELPKKIQAKKTIWVKGQVYDDKTKLGLPSAVVLTNLKTKQIVSKLQTDEDGNYLVTLPIGDEYAFTVNRKGYLLYSENYRLVDYNLDSSFTNNIPLQSLLAGANIVLKNIFFDSNKFELKPESETELDNLVALLLENPNLRITLNGYTDNIGSPATNLQLSKNRALSVKQYLESKGIASSRLLYKGFGEANPIAPNTTEEGRIKNRRTELIVL